MKRFLGLVAAGSVLLALTPAVAAQAADSTIAVNLGSSTGAVTNGASGFLYGLGEDGIPNDNTVASLHPDSTYQKAPDGQQHPHGDALRVASQWARDGGKDVGVYMQDYFTNWPYENPGIDAYLKIVDAQAEKIVADPNRSRYIYVPFNEPNWIWYAGNLDGLEHDWKLAYQHIKAIDPAARIAGPNFSVYDANAYRDFLQFAKDNAVVPDVTSWHELENDFFSSWYDHVDSYRAIERSVGITPRPIAINEYGRAQDIAVPGNLVQWITRLENSKVRGNLAFWTDTGSLNDLVAANESNRVTGAWWLYKWYGELTGNTVAVIPPTKNGPLQALGTYDAAKKQARVLLGGSLNSSDVFSSDVAFSNVPAALGSRVHAVVWATDSTGSAVSNGPSLMTETDLTVSNGRATLSLSGLKGSSAYQVVLTGDTDTSTVQANRYDAEYADLAGGANVASAQAGYTGTGYVGGYANSSTASTKFVVNVPTDGYYNVGLRYAAAPMNGAPTDRKTRVVLNGAAVRDLSLPGTADGNSWKSTTTKLYLQGGINRISINAFTNDNSDAIAVDSVDVSATTGATQVIEAEASENQRSGAAAVSSNASASGGAYVGNIGRGSQNSLTFTNVQAPSAGTYDVVVRYANNENASGSSGADYNTNSINRYTDLTVNGTAAGRQYYHVTGSWSSWRTTIIRATLKAGSNTITFANSTTNAPDIDNITVAKIAG